MALAIGKAPRDERTGAKEERVACTAPAGTVLVWTGGGGGQFYSRPQRA